MLYNKQNLAIPESAKPLHQNIVVLLLKLYAIDQCSACDPQFLSIYREFLDLFQRYQDIVVEQNRFKKSCSKGCGFCCYHWVEDVYAFEVQIIVEHIRTILPDTITGLVEKCREDERQYECLRKIMDEKLAGLPDELIADIDTTDLLLASFYQLGRPCPLQKDDKSCAIYPLRPLTCRKYMSFSSPRYCHPDFIENAGVPTYLLDLEDDAGELLDALHARYARTDSTGLRTVLLENLR